MEQIGPEGDFNEGKGMNLHGNTSQSEQGATQGYFSQVNRGAPSASEREAATRGKTSSQELSEALDRLLERWPGCVGEQRVEAKKEFLELAARLSRPGSELLAKSTQVANRVAGSIREGWETQRSEAETFMHANPARAVGLATAIGVLLGGIWVRIVLSGRIGR